MIGVRWAQEMYDAITAPRHYTPQEREEARVVKTARDREAEHARYRRRLEKVV